MIEPHSAQLGESAWAENVTFGPPAESELPPSDAAIDASPFPLLLPLPFDVAALLVAMTASSSRTTGTGIGMATEADGAEPADAEADDAWAADALGAASEDAGVGAGAGTGACAEIASDWAVIPSSARGARADAPNGEGASDTICDRSMSPRLALSSAGRKRDPSQRKM